MEQKAKKSKDKLVTVKNLQLPVWCMHTHTQH